MYQMKILILYFAFFSRSGNNPVDKEQNVINKHEPVIRTATHTPPNLAQRFSNSMARPSTAKAALQRGVLPRKVSYPNT